MSKKQMTMVTGLAAAGLSAASGCGPQWELGLQTYTLRENTLLETIDKVAELGLEEIEAFSGQRVGAEFGNMRFDEKSSPEARAAVRAKLAQADVEMAAYYFHNLGVDEAVTRQIFELAKEMDADIIVCEPPADKMELVDQLANEYGVNIAIHNHARNPGQPEYCYWNPDEVMKVLEGRSKRLGACPDVGHWARSGLDTVESLKKYQGRLMCIHLKDAAKPERDAEDVVWGKGVANIKGVLAEMYRQGFAGLASIEYEANPKDNMAELAECIKFHNQEVKALSK